jgi:hypothetical protein
LVARVRLIVPTRLARAQSAAGCTLRSASGVLDRAPATRYLDAARPGPPSSRGSSMLARIYRPAKTAMQSGKASSRGWRLEFEPASARTIDPLMGWTSSSDMNGQVRLSFDSAEEAVAYAERHGIPFRLHEPQDPPLILKAYADNFATGRKVSWTH